ncbi:MAG: alpha/beta hydrolase [Candidatus Hadarchaeales archaeon]
MPFAEVGGIKIFYEKVGNGFPVYLLHGAVLTHSLWKPQLEVLKERYTAIAPDLPGHGKSNPISSDEPSIRGYSEVVAGLMDYLGTKEAVVVGHSMGGAVALQFTLDHPEKVRALILANTGAKLGVSPLLLQVLRENFRGAMEAGWKSMLGGKGRRMERELEGLRREMEDTEPKVGVADFEACNAFDCRSRLHEIKKPTLIIGGYDDTLTPPWYHEYLHKNIQGSSLALLRDVGHLSMVEDPSSFNSLLLDFLGRTVG